MNSFVQTLQINTRCIIYLSTFFICLVSFSIKAQTVFWTEDFETDGNGTRYTAINQFIDGLDGSVEDFFGRIEDNGGAPRLVDLPCVNGSNNILDITNPFSGPNNDYYMGGEDMNDALDSGGCGSPNTGTPVRSVIFSGINITGASMITGKILIANGASNGCNTTPSRWDLGEGLKIFVNVDGTGDNAVLCLAPTITCGGAASNSNEPLFTDNASSIGGACSGDGTGGTFVSNTFTEYDFIVTGGPGFSILDLRIEIDADASDEEIAFDYVRLLAVSPPLPVELISFDARANEREMNLTWETAVELNNDYFQIEHSLDGVNFNSIGIQKGQGTTEFKTSYFFRHRQPIQGMNYYRLKQIDFDASFKYSQIRAIDFDGKNDNIHIVPNPVTNILQIHLTKPYQEDTEFKILDIMGRTVYTGLFSSVQNSKRIDLSDLTSGLYILSIYESGRKIEKKILKN